MRKRKQEPKRRYTGTEVIVASDGTSVTASEKANVVEMVPTER